MAIRKEIEDRVLQIIKYIDHNKKLKPLVWSIKLFQTEELLQLKDFLESGNYKPIYILLDEKIKEYVSVIKKVKQVKISEKMKKVKNDEINEKRQEDEELEKILEF